MPISESMPLPQKDNTFGSLMQVFQLKQRSIFVYPTGYFKRGGVFLPPPFDFSIISATQLTQLHLGWNGF